MKDFLRTAALILGTALLSSASALAASAKFGPAIGPPPPLQSYFNWMQEDKPSTKIDAWMSPDVYDQFLSTGLDTPLGRGGAAPGPKLANVDGQVYEYDDSLGTGWEGGRMLYVVRLKPTGRTPAHGDPLAGTWTLRSRGWPDSTWTFTRLGDGRYDAKQSGAGGATGTAELQGRHLHINFKWGSDGVGHEDVDLNAAGTAGTGTDTNTHGPLAGNTNQITLTR